MNEHRYCVIMAGGVGSRFWPYSRARKPKQFLDILGTGRSLLQMTYDRFRKLCPEENILIVTNKEYTDLVKEQLPGILPDQVLSEPFRKNTAPCIAYASEKIRSVDPEGVMVVAPSDHYIQDEEKFLEVIEEGFSFVERHEALLTIGIEPTRPETGYGYIQIKKDTRQDTKNDLYKVKTFTEKPNRELAQVFLESGDFYWNAGIFLWSVKSILAAFEKYMPDIYHIFAEGRGIYHTEKEEAFIYKAYSNCTEISIDYAIMEKAENVYVICADFGWSDLGTWNSLYEHSELDDHGNMVTGDPVFLYEVKGSIIHTDEGKLLVAYGLEDYIVVQSGEITLICPKKEEQRIKQFVKEIQIKTGDKYI